MTKVTASVSRANSSPRSRFMRNTTVPMPTPSNAAIAAATGTVTRNGTFALVVSVAVVYMPTPKNAA